MGLLGKNSFICFDVFKILVIAMVVTCTLLGALLLENESHLSPQPKASLLFVPSFRAKLSNRTDKLSSNTKDLYSKETHLKSTETWAIKSGTKISTKLSPYNYYWTSLWGKQNATLWNRIYGDINCPDNSRRKALTGILKAWIEIAKKNDIEYALSYGSLIGIVRNNDVLPWDEDIDVLVDYNDVLKLEKLGWPRDINYGDGKTYVNFIPVSEHNKPVDERFRWNCQGKVTLRHIDQCSIQEPFVRLYNNDAFMDVYDYYVKKDTIEFYSEGQVFVIQKKHYFPPRPCLFMGYDTWCPNDPINFLAGYYGKDFIISVKKCVNGQWMKSRKKKLRYS